MKATVWLWPVVTLICASPFVSVYAQQEYQSYADFPSDNSFNQDYFAEKDKRTKPSLSIVNPIDVLRQRLLLEIARRQMKENTKQVELNRQYLKNIGKRGTAHKQLQQQQQQQQEQSQHQILQYPMFLPSSSTSSLLQQKSQQYQNKQQLQQQQQQQHNRNRLQSHPYNKIFDFLRQQSPQQQQQQSQLHENGDSIGGIGDDGISASAALIARNDLKDNVDMTDNELNDNSNDDDNDYQLRYLYRLHKNRFLRE
ncbi:putative mediator of RNA polymerase II transcription subunit 26 [Condylostylus longicornis]|uniref:putative mediator of RNA polymerase II transcription subunit 26 n=1 Tax=Condylostylus longicornis TaxID=2530218 RepID=UPI00244DF568|nr:putative mediator of RNA polymerase II transcription subunit 26 [Condylostylus longicornis]